MTFPGLHWIRRRQRALARAVLALFCAVWLQAALMPCAMAVVPGAGASAPMEHCAYCPPADTAGDRLGAGGAATCTYPDQPQSDTRVATASALAFTTLPVVLTVAPLAPDAGAYVPEQARPPAFAPTPLAVSYCRFLK